MEIWKDIKGYEGLYQVSNLGRVKSLDRYCNYNGTNKRKLIGKILKNGSNKVGYLLVGLYKNNIGKSFRVHRLVAMSFIDNPTNKDQVNHINGIKYDNRVENLEWSNYSENQLHAYKIGLSKPIRGEKHGLSKLTSEKILLIKADTRKQREIAIDYNISQATISFIKNSKTWAHI